MKIYVDIIFLENTVMNFIILYATGIILKLRISIWRMALSSVIGAIYVAIGYVISIEYFVNIFGKILLSVTMIFTAFNPKGFKTIIKELIIFYLTTFTFGGVATYLIYVIKPQGKAFAGKYALKIIFVGALIGTTILVLAFKMVKNKVTKKDMLYKIKIKFNGTEKILNAIIDTGNMLREPISGLPVAVIEKEVLYNVLPQELLDNIDSILGGDVQKLQEKIRIKFETKLVLIPFASLGKEHGMLVGVKLDEFYVLQNDVFIKKNAIIGIYNKKLSKNRSI